MQADGDWAFRRFRRQPTHLRGMMTRAEVVDDPIGLARGPVAIDPMLDGGDTHPSVARRFAARQTPITIAARHPSTKANETVPSASSAAHM